MTGPQRPWTAPLQSALTRTDRRDPQDRYSVVSYALVPGHEGELVAALTDLVMFLWQAVADVAALESWSGGGLARSASWSRLLTADPDNGDRETLKAYVGEAIAWWHEECDPGVIYAGRPSNEVSQPIVDSISLLRCSDENVIKAVQAKAGYGTARPRFREATGNFGRLLKGDFDSFWNDRIRQFSHELRAEGALTVTPSGLLAGELAHFAILIAHAKPSLHDPGRDYGTRVPAHDPDGRTLVLVEHLTFSGVVSDLALSIEGRLSP